MKTIFTIAAAFAVLTMGVFAQNFSSRKINVPKDFIANGIAVDAQGNLYLSTYGLLRSTDKGASWQITGDIIAFANRVPIISSGASIENLTYTGGARLYGNISEIGLFSEDKGLTWKALETENDMHVIGHTGDTLYGTGPAGDLFILKPGASQWILHPEIGDFDANFVYTMKMGFILVLGAGEFRAYVPALGQWAPGTFTGLGETRFNAAADIGINLWLGTEDGLYSVNMISQSVVKINLPDAPSQTPIITDVISVGDTALYVATAEYGVWGSSDKGASWNKISASEDFKYVSGLAWLDGGLYASTATGVYRIQFGSSSEVENLTDNSNFTLGGVGFLGDKALFASLTELYTSTGGDWASNWTKYDMSLNVGIYTGVPFNVGNKLYFANSNFLASWDGETISESNSNFLNLNTAVATKDGKIWAIDHTVLKLSADGGATFIEEGPLDVPIYYGVWANQINSNVLIYTDEGLYASEDAGANWAKLQFDISDTDFSDALYYGDTIMIADENGKIYFTEDLGASWSEITPDSSADFPFYALVNDFARGTDGVIYLATNVGLFYKLNASAPFVKINKPEFAGMPAYLAGVSASGELYFGFMNGIYKVSHTGTGIAMERVVKFKFAPNPARESVQLLSEELPVKVEIYSANGTLRLSLDRPERTIAISSLEPGAYIIKLYTASGAETQTFIKE